MTTYLVRLNGQNFLIDGDEGLRKKRFCSTRLVEAKDQDRAETLARELIFNDPHLKNSVLNQESDPPIIYIESVIEIPATAYDAQNRAQMFCWENKDNEKLGTAQPRRVHWPACSASYFHYKWYRN